MIAKNVERSNREVRKLKKESVIAEKVKDLIKEKGLKCCYVAQKAGYSQQQFSAMLNNRKVITDVDVAKIAGALEVSVNKLFEN